MKRRGTFITAMAKRDLSRVLVAARASTILLTFSLSIIRYCCCCIRLLLIHRFTRGFGGHHGHQHGRPVPS